MFGWFSDASASASRRKRLTRSASRENSSGKIFIATSRFNFVSRARYTSPIPPLPRRAVISSEPSRVPTSTDMGISLKRNTALRGIMPRSDKGSKLNRGVKSSDHCAVFSRKAYLANDVLEDGIGFDGIQEGIDLK